MCELSQKQICNEKDVLKIETVVQFIEGFVYLWLSFAITNLDTMIDRRYFDWTITTPLMLISTIIFMEYNLIKDDMFVNDEFFNYESEKYKINLKRVDCEYIGEPYDENDNIDLDMRKPLEKYWKN